MRINGLRQLLIVWLSGIAGVGWGQEDPSHFQHKAGMIIEQTADHYRPPSLNIGDPEKYYWPLVMARFEKYGIKDSLANACISILKDRSPFHFTLVGMARLMMLYPQAPALAAHKAEILQQVFARKDSYNAWTGEGTENHVSMSRTSGYLYAQEALKSTTSFPRAELRLQQMKKWISYWSGRIYQVGSGEWHSGIYEVFNLIGWLNLFDFADDPEVKLMARAVLDYYAAELALHHSWGLPGGAEMRGNGINRSQYTATTYLNWLWFSPDPNLVQGFQKNDYIQCLHAITSTYRPPQLAVKLAQKALTQPAWYQNSKPGYLLHQPSLVKQFFYIGTDYTLGSMASPYGGFTGTTYQIINWKLVKQQLQALPLEISGNGVFWENWQGKTRDPWTQWGQFKNVLFQITRVPKNASQLYRKVEKEAIDWNKAWKKDFLKRFPAESYKRDVYHQPERVNFENASYINLPVGIPLTWQEDVLVVDLDQQWLLICCLNQKRPQLDSIRLPGRLILLDQASPGDDCGFVLEMVEKSVLPQISDLSKNRLNRDREGWWQYRSCQQQEIAMNFGEAGIFQEALVDWGFGVIRPEVIMQKAGFRQPQWPYGMGYGKVPALKINGKPMSLNAEWPVFEGPDLQLKKGVLMFKGEGSSYTIDYSGRLPVFK
ncbi:MAG: hypothetical protein ACNS62_00035 [Candidatus Cyclobacteriaceae bacterium M3_2C_046]